MRPTLIRLIATAISLSLCYFALVVGDFLLYRLSVMEMTDAQKLEQRRIEAEDKKLISEAKARQLQPVFYPGSVEQYTNFMHIEQTYGVIPLGAQLNEHVYFCNEGYGLIEYKTDRFGFRNPDRVWDEPNVDILLIGDSFVHGACVSNQHTISSYLEESFTSINLGSLADHPYIYSAKIKTFAPKIGARHVVLVFYANDNLHLSKDNIFKASYLDNDVSYFAGEGNDLGPSQNVIEASAEIKRALALGLENEGNQSKEAGFDGWGLAFRALTYLRLSNIRNIVSSVFGERLSGSTLLLNPIPVASKAAIDQLKKYCTPSGCEPLIIYIPASKVWRNDPRCLDYSEALRNYAENVGVNFKTMSDIFENHEENEVYALKGPHLSPKGYKLVAETIASELKSQL